MRILRQAAFGAAIICAGGLALAGGGTGSAVIAGSAPVALDRQLVPQDIMDAALAEQSSLPDAIELPERRRDQGPKADSLDHASLAELVSANLGAQTQDREHECLAIGVYFESKGEPLAGQLAVAEVILNRVGSGRFAGSVCGVLTQPGQFSFVRGGALPSVPRGSLAWKQAVAIATIARNDLTSSGVGRALYFHARRVAPSWSLTRVATIGNHVFYR